MKILDTKKAKERHEAEAEAEEELREFEKWLNSAQDTSPPNYDDLKGLFDGHGGHSGGYTTLTPDAVKDLVDSLRKMSPVP